MLFGLIHLTEDRAILKPYLGTTTQRNDADVDPGSEWIWTRDTSFRVLEDSTHALDRMANPAGHLHAI
jgi:hypothetical protein